MIERSKRRVEKGVRKKEGSEGKKKKAKIMILFFWVASNIFFYLDHLKKTIV